MNYFYKSCFWLQFSKLDAESVNKKFEIICKWMRQLIVKFRPGSHQGSFGQLSVKKGLLSVITTRFLMRSVFLKFLKFWKFWGSFKDTEVYGGAGRFWEKKQDTDSGAVNASHLTHMWPAVKLLMFSFLLFAIFLLTTRWDHSQCKIFLIFTLHWLRSDQAGPMGILSNRFCLIDDAVVIMRQYLIVQQVWFVTLIAWPTPGQLKVGKKKMIAKLKSRKKQYEKWQQEEWRVLVSLWVGSL